MSADSNLPIITRPRSAVLSDLRLLVAESGFVYTIAFLVLKDLTINLKAQASVNWYERLSFREISFLAGLLVTQAIDPSCIPSELTVESQALRARALLSELHQTHLTAFRVALQSSRSTEANADNRAMANAHFASPEMVTEAIFYAEPPGFDFQCWTLSAEKYAHDSNWLLAHKGFSISELIAIAKHLKALSENKLRTWKPAVTFEEHSRAALDVLCFSRADLEGLSHSTVTAFLETFALRPGDLNAGLVDVGCFNALDARPIIELEPDRYCLPVGFSLSHSIYESPFYWMHADEQYRPTAMARRGEYAESAATGFLERTFGRQRVYRDVKVYRKKHEQVTDIDVLAIAGNRAVIVQVKSKRLTELARRGDEVRLRKDFALAVQAAYEQALLARRAILEAGSTLETSDGKILKLSEIIKDAYIVCVTADHYPAISHQLSVYLNKEASAPLPVAVSLFDLDILTTYLTDPFACLYYLRQRRELHDYFYASSEVNYLGYHLRHKLYRKRGFDHMTLEHDWASGINADLPRERGYRAGGGGPDEVRTHWNNTAFDTLIAQIKSTGEPSLTDALFLLYDVAGNAIDELMAGINSTRARTIRDGLVHTYAVGLQDAPCGISYVCLPDDREALEQYVLRFAMAKKYRMRSNEWLGLGGLTSEMREVSTFVYSKEPWKSDKKLEALSAATLRTGMSVAPAFGKTGRNASCPCGTGLKFKKCCGR